MRRPTHGKGASHFTFRKTSDFSPEEEEDTRFLTPPTFGRHAEIPVEQMTAEQQAGYRFLADGPRGRLPGPYRAWVHNPALVHAVAPPGNHFTPGKSALSERERETAVLVICSTWGSAYPTNSHERRGKEVGLPAAQRAGRRSAPKGAGGKAPSATCWRRRRIDE
jgi:alkylhydroperoxidase family enzyme